MDELAAADQKMFEAYAKELKVLPGVLAKHTENNDREAWAFQGNAPKALPVTLYLWKRGASFVGLEIEGVDCSYWHTAEEESLDFHIETAIAALQGKVQFNRSPIFRRKEGCFEVQKGTWVCVPVNSIFANVATRKKLNHPVDP